MSRATPPLHRLRLTLNLGVDTPDDLVNELRLLADRLEREGCDGPARMAAGFPGGSWDLRIEHDPDMTPERFKVELAEWASATRKADA